MGSVNKVILVGNLGADPELRYTDKGKAVCTMRLATNRSYKDHDGVRQDQTSWHRVVAWGKQGEVCKEYLSKGRQVYVEGRLQTNAYTDQAGTKRYSTEVVTNSVVFLGKNGSNGTRSGGAAAASKDDDAAETEPDDDIPF
jgi:single-strand DNA-binding protein